MAKRTQARSIETKARVLKATKDLSAKNGMSGVTAEAIAKQAGVAKGTVFSHFGDMDGLLSHVLIERLAALGTESKTFGASEQKDINPVDLLSRKMTSFVEVISSDETVLKLFLENIGVTKPNCAPEFIATLDALDEELCSFLTYWQKEETLFPKIRTDRDPKELLDGLFAFMIHGAILHSCHQQENLSEIEARLSRHIEAYLLETASS